MTRLRDFEDFSYGLGRPYLSRGTWRDGARHSFYRCEHGLAEVSEYTGNPTPVTLIIFTWQGRVFHRRWRRLWGDKTLAKLSRELVRDVVEVRI